jgi:hypothetical protein
LNEAPIGRTPTPPSPRRLLVPLQVSGRGLTTTTTTPLCNNKKKMKKLGGKNVVWRQEK